MIIKPLFPAAGDKTSNNDSDILLLIVRIRHRCYDGKPPKKNMPLRSLAAIKRVSLRRRSFTASVFPQLFIIALNLYLVERL